MVTNTQLEIIARIINKTVNPESVFLFGSYAEGTPNENSDLDIAIIKNTVEDKHESLYQIRKALSYLGIPMDILLFETKNYHLNKNVYGTVQYEVAHKGKQLS